MTHLFEGDVKKNLLERSEAEKVFRPWWDTLEDYLLNILIVIGQSVNYFILNTLTTGSFKAFGRRNEAVNRGVLGL